jgi:hypothetical protein
MNPASSKPDINVSTLPLISGFVSKDCTTFTKTINHLNQEYAVVITFKITDSALHKTAFLKKINEDIEKTVKISVELGLGSVKVKGKTDIKPERDYTITSLKFQFNNNNFKSNKTKANKDGTITTSTLKEPIFRKNDNEDERKKKYRKYLNFREIKSIYEKANNSLSENSNIDQPQNLPKETVNILESEKNKIIYKATDYQNNLSVNNQIAKISVSLKPQENLKPDESRIPLVKTQSKQLSPRETPIVELNDDDYSKFIEEYDDEIKYYLKRQAVLLSDYNSCDLFKCTNSDELRKYKNDNIPENFSQIITDRNIFIAQFKQSIYFKETEAKKFILNNNKKIFEALCSFIDKYKTAEKTLKEKGKNNETNELKLISDEWGGFNFEKTPFLDYLTFEKHTPILNSIAFFENYKKKQNFDSLLYPITYLSKNSC